MCIANVAVSIFSLRNVRINILWSSHATGIIPEFRPNFRTLNWNPAYDLVDSSFQIPIGVKYPKICSIVSQKRILTTGYKQNYRTVLHLLWRSNRIKIFRCSSKKHIWKTILYLTWILPHFWDINFLKLTKWKKLSKN